MFPWIAQPTAQKAGTRRRDAKEILFALILLIPPRQDRYLFRSEVEPYIKFKAAIDSCQLFKIDSDLPRVIWSMSNVKSGGFR